MPAGQQIEGGDVAVLRPAPGDASVGPRRSPDPLTAPTTSFAPPAVPRVRRARLRRPTAERILLFNGTVAAGRGV